MDANFFMPPDRSKTTNVRPYSFEDFKQNWLVSLLSEFVELSMHEAVYDELICYLYKTGKYDNKALRVLYKYQYYLTPRDKKNNPEWGFFVEQMDKLYNENIQNT
ncbi:MAG: hypothetical protein RR683_02680 [Lachnospiraceae bacterium]